MVLGILSCVHSILRSMVACNYFSYRNFGPIWTRHSNQCAESMGWIRYGVPFHGDLDAIYKMAIDDLYN